MKKSILIIVVLFASTLWAQQINSDSLIIKKTLGTELDLLPYISGGYYVSAWYGIDQFRFRAILTKTTVPQFAVADGYAENKLNVYAFITDYFLRKILKDSGSVPDLNTGIQKLRMKPRIKLHHTTTPFLLWAGDMCGSSMIIFI